MKQISVCPFCESENIRFNMDANPMSGMIFCQEKNCGRNFEKAKEIFVEEEMKITSASNLVSFSEDDGTGYGCGCAISNV